MDGQRFDALARTFGRSGSRRRFLRAGAGGLLALLGVRAVGGQSRSDCLDAPCSEDGSEMACITPCGAFCCSFNQVCDCGGILPPDQVAGHCVCKCPYPFEETRDGACVCPAEQRCGPTCCAADEGCCGLGDDSYCFYEGTVKLTCTDKAGDPLPGTDLLFPTPTPAP